MPKRRPSAAFGLLQCELEKGHEGPHMCRVTDNLMSQWTDNDSIRMATFAYAPILIDIDLDVNGES